MPVFFNADVKFDSSDISAFVTSVNIDTGSEALDNTTMANTTKISTPGLKNWGCTINVNNNFASDSLDDVLTPFNAFGTTFTLSVKPSATGGDADNPEWSGLAAIQSYNPISGSVGDLSKSAIVLMPCGTLTRATATA